MLVYAVKKDKISPDHVIINSVDEFSERDLMYYFQCFMYNCVVLDPPLNKFLLFGTTFLLSEDCEEKFPNL